MSTPGFALRFKADRIPALAKRYLEELRDEVAREERRIESRIAPAVRQRGFYTYDEFVALCRWKSRRAKSRYEAVDEELVIEATMAALGARDELLRIGTLTLLDGVSWPTASVLLHFGHRDPYPILDVRALASLGVSPPSGYSFAFWWRYVETCRRLARRHTGGDMRMLDRALWQWSADRARARS